MTAYTFVNNYEEVEPRKTLPKTAVPRIFFIDQEIASGTYPNAPYLAEKWETSLSSIHRDIAYMRDMMRAPIKYDFFKKGFYYTEKAFRLSSSYATEEDILALGMAKSILELYRDTPIYDAALNLLENISVPLGGTADRNWYKDRIIIPKSITVQVNPDVWKSVVLALQENRSISFSYEADNLRHKNEKERKQKISIRKVQPYQLLFDRSAWYLSGYDENRQDRRIFALSRISRISVTQEKFTLKEGFDYRNSEGLSYFGIYKDQKSYKFVIEIKGDVLWITERQWAEDQKIQKTADGIKLSFTSNQFEKVLTWLLSLGENARPLAPALLIEKWTAAIQKMYEMSKIKNNVR